MSLNALAQHVCDYCGVVMNGKRGGWLTCPVEGCQAEVCSAELQLHINKEHANHWRADR